ncbi:MAG: hypothetical protein A2X13_14715 [Bacteroidetes bacterium GWC2_33_15]|nr:MAG: hypothetical protein A2X10_06780 [Bacteroidetes bacterium GWA2_33_15]OFX50125.1 MAG: hypothetical protein A2X13_14715 [Bacteroidetes bacterium GWC2_33_15]OFX65278.1 MAG: hypothetical protein A2X15_04290 [Bacteroidetes bacterium GWB2_32_14]OFX70504.1 MAG: hypothetical protein A2X14_04345 [Bacteroidetes bacterium GWD2_33_33]HAN19623.1 hypothetical protein [Bacteroidales bacterium]
MPGTIRLDQLLNEWDKIKTGDVDASFSIAFITKNGEYRYYKRAVKSGANMNLKDNEMRGCIPIDGEGKNNGHYTAISIWKIVEFNQQKVVL